MSKTHLKRGPLSSAEKNYITANHKEMDHRLIAQKLNRPEARVLQHIAEIAAPHLAEPDAAGRGLDKTNPARAEVRKELRSSITWQLLPDEFTAKEIRLFEERYVALKSQFREDVMASEEGQLFKAIKLEILMHRNMLQQKRSEEDIDRLEACKMRKLTAHKDKEDEPLGDEDKVAYDEVENALMGAYAQKQARTTEYTKLNDQHQGLMKSLKATREQRISRVESSRLSMLDIIRNLQDEDKADREGRLMEMAKKAKDKETLRLGAEHRYGDGTTDRPLLNAETVDLPSGDDDDDDDSQSDIPPPVQPQDSTAPAEQPSV